MSNAMRFVEFTRADASPVLVSVKEIVTCAPVPADARIEQGTRITFRNGGHQDVKELVADVLRVLTPSA
jgi:hypothetical protein